MPGAQKEVLMVVVAQKEVLLGARGLKQGAGRCLGLETRC